MTEIRIEPSPFLIRVSLHGQTIAESAEARLVFATGRYPEYYLPRHDVVLDTASGGRGRYGVRRNDELGAYDTLLHPTTGAAVGRAYASGLAAGFAQLDFESMDAWFEEDQEIYFRVRDPYRRVDVVRSCRSVEVRVRGIVVARTTQPFLVVETGLPARWYVAADDVSWDQLSKSNTTSACQYKGEASWFHVHLNDATQLNDVAWVYEESPEATKLAGLIGFYTEHSDVDTLVDGLSISMSGWQPEWMNPSLGLSNQSFD